MIGVGERFMESTPCDSRRPVSLSLVILGDATTRVLALALTVRLCCRGRISIETARRVGTAMTERGEGKKPGPRRPHQGGPGSRPGPGGGHDPRAKPGPAKKPGGLRLTRLGGPDFELDHPRCVREMELDYAEGIALWEEGDVEEARDALRFALQGCGDNLWVHVALGRIALQEFKDPSLARGHFGYAFELAQRALPPGFSGRLPPDRPANRPFYDAIDGLAMCYEALGQGAEAARLRDLSRRLEGDRPHPPSRPVPR